MSENTEQQPDVTPEPAVPAALRDVDPEKLRALKEKIKKFTASDKTTVSGSEAPSEGAATGPVSEGKDVDWSEYDLDYNVRHLYPRAAFRETPEGPKWVVVLEEFVSSERSFGSHDQKTSSGEFKNVGQYLNEMLNSPEDWKVVSLLPTSVGRVGVLLRKATIAVLPDPKPLKKVTEVPAPADPELEREQDAALKFMTSEGLAPKSSLEAVALALNGPAERDPAQARTLEAPMDEAAGVVAEAALQGEDFGADPSAVIGQESNAGIHAEQSEFGAPPAVEG